MSSKEMTRFSEGKLRGTKAKPSEAHTPLFLFTSHITDQSSHVTDRKSQITDQRSQIIGGPC
jgi:hypothetical protein